MSCKNSIGCLDRLLVQRDTLRPEKEKSGHQAVSFDARRLKISCDIEFSEGKFNG